MCLVASNNNKKSTLNILYQYKQYFDITKPCFIYSDCFYIIDYIFGKKSQCPHAEHC